MKNLSIALVLVAASVSFANAQNTDTAKKMDNVAEQEMKAEAAAEVQSMKMDTVAPLKVEDSAVKVEDSALKEEAIKERSKTEAAKVRKEEKAKAKKVDAM